MIEITLAMQFSPGDIRNIPVKAHSTKTPGLAICHAIRVSADGNITESSKFWQMVHIPSGYKVLTTATLSQARKAAVEFGKLFDWTQPLSVVQSNYHLYAKELCKIRDECQR